MRSSYPIVLIAVLTACSGPSHVQQKGTESPVNSATAQIELVHVQGAFTGILPTGKRHQSFVFTFHVEDALYGELTDTEIRFELYQDFGGRDLIAAISGQKPMSGLDLVAAASSVTGSTPYQLVLRVFPARQIHTIHGMKWVNAHLITSPQALRP